MIRDKHQDGDRLSCVARLANGLVVCKCTAWVNDLMLAIFLLPSSLTSPTLYDLDCISRWPVDQFDIACTILTR